jgi:hypothetical protein
MSRLARHAGFAIGIVVPLTLSVSMAMARDIRSRATDLELVKTEYVRPSPAFSAVERRRALDLIAKEETRVARLSRAQFVLSLMEIQALADNAHDVLSTGKGAWWPRRRLPLRLIWFPNGWVVAEAAPHYAELLGARVLTIEELSAKTMLARLRRYWGGPDAYRLWNLPLIIENAGLLHAAGIAQDADRLHLTARLRDGRIEAYTIKFVPWPETPPDEGRVCLWSADPWPNGTSKGWRTATGSDEPMYLRDCRQLYRVLTLPEYHAVYMQLRGQSDAPGRNLMAFAHQVDSTIAADHPKNLIVDLRFDIGTVDGREDLLAWRNWLRTLPGRVPGRIFVLVGRYTFSSGIVTAAALKHDARERVRIVGGPLADHLIWWSEGRNLALPYSHYQIRLTTGLWNLVSGCSGRPDCYGDEYDAAVGNLTPDLPAPLTARDWIAGRDPGLAAIREELAR